MRTFLIGGAFGLILGAIAGMTGVGWSQSPKTSPYSSTNLMGETNLYGAIMRQQDELDSLRRAQRDGEYPSLYGDRPCR